MVSKVEEAMKRNKQMQPQAQNQQQQLQKQIQCNKGSLGAIANGGSRKLLVEVLILGKNGVKMASPLPFYVFTIVMLA